jgi:predicted transcriptional regulator
MEKDKDKGKNKDKQPNYYLNKYDGLREIGRWVSITSKFCAYMIQNSTENSTKRLTTEEFKVLFYLISQLEFNSQNLIEINQINIATALDKHKSSISKTIKKLRELNIIAKKEKKIYMFNPRFIFINGTNDIHNYLKNYEDIENQKFADYRDKQLELQRVAKRNVKIKEKLEQSGITDPNQIQKIIDIQLSPEEIEYALIDYIVKKR